MYIYIHYIYIYIYIYIYVVAGFSSGKVQGPQVVHIRRWLNGYLAQLVPNPRGKNTFQDCTMQTVPKSAGYKKTRSYFRTTYTMCF